MRAVHGLLGGDGVGTPSAGEATVVHGALVMLQLMSHRCGDIPRVVICRDYS